MHYPDLSLYSYSKFPEKLRKRHDIGDDVVFYNVGWLDIAADYRLGFVGKEFLSVFLEHVKSRSNMFRGYHCCPFCAAEKPESDSYFDNYERTIMDIEGEEYTFGSMEIAVFGEKCIYIAPDMIYHYMKDHFYVPPDAFCEAVMPGGKWAEGTAAPNYITNVRQLYVERFQQGMVIDTICPQLAELYDLLRTIGETIGEQELAHAIPDHEAILRRLEWAKELSGFQPYSVRQEIYKLMDGEIFSNFNKYRRLFPDKEAVTPTFHRLVALLNEVVRETA